MLTKTIKYTDYDGNEREETYYFNLTSAELIELEGSVQGGLSNYMKTMLEKKDVPKLLELFKMLIEKSYGVKSNDGKRFVKKENGVRLVDEFMETEAYSSLYMSLISNDTEAEKFFKGLIPQSVATQLPR